MRLTHTDGKGGVHVYECLYDRGSSFRGLHVIRALRARGIPVYALATSEAAADTVLQAGATPVRGSLSDQAALQTGMQQCDLVLHLDMLEGVALPFDELYQANVVGTQEVIKAARAAQVTRLVVASTESVLLGSGPLINVDETRPHPKKPLCDYTRVMGLVEDEALAAHSPELSTVIVRPRLIWGPGDTNNLPQLVAAVRTGAFAWIGGGYHPGLLQSRFPLKRLNERALSPDSRQTRVWHEPRWFLLVWQRGQAQCC